MNDEKDHSVLRIEIQGAWYSCDLAEFFSSISHLYTVQVKLVRDQFCRANWGSEWDREEYKLADWDDPLPLHSRDRFGLVDGPISMKAPKSVYNFVTIGNPHGTPLRYLKDAAVVAIQYGSPGFADFVGLGKGMEEVRKFLETLIKRRDDARLRAAQDERYELENQRIRIENARAFVALAQDAGVGPEDMVRLLAYVDEQQLPLARLVGTYQINSVKEIPSDVYRHKVEENDVFRSRPGATNTSEGVGGLESSPTPEDSEDEAHS
jgi:hypothetical protein